VVMKPLRLLQEQIFHSWLQEYQRKQ
jgi:hypothetical protein